MMDSRKIITRSSVSGFPPLICNPLRRLVEKNSDSIENSFSLGYLISIHSGYLKLSLKHAMLFKKKYCKMLLYWTTELHGIWVGIRVLHMMEFDAKCLQLIQNRKIYV
jgi:hypothetical protein